MPAATERRRTAWLAALTVLVIAALSSACTHAPAVSPVPTAAAASAPAARPASSAPSAPAAAAATAPSPAAASAAPADAVSAAAEVASVETAARAFYAYFDRVRQMSSTELGREFARLDQPSSPTAVLELALALGQTRNPSDTVRALAALDPLVRSTDPQYAPWRPLARLLAVRYTEQRRLEEQIERQTQQLRDAQRRQEQLAQQLEALKAIERSLNNRPAPAPASASSRPPAP